MADIDYVTLEMKLTVEEFLCMGYVMKSSENSHFGGTPCIHLQGLQVSQAWLALSLKMEGMCSSKKSAHFYHTICIIIHMADHFIINSENLKINITEY
jgi:hypothetical protein